MRDQNGAVSICALVPYPPGVSPSQRYRIEQWMPHLREMGISVDLIPFADERLMRLLHKPGRRAAKACMGAMKFARRFFDVAAAARYDAVLVHRASCIAGPALPERLIALLGKPLIFDFDDAIFMLHTTEANRRMGWLKFPGKTATICRISSHVVAGNTFLADYARKYNSRVTIIPSSIDISRYQPVEKKNSRGPIVIGWTGSSTSQTHLEMFAPVLRRLAARRNVVVRVISDREPRLDGVPYIWRPWSAEMEVEDLAHFDIGMMPMPDDKWSRGKCALKALQYMAMGIPTVCSAVGANCEVIRHSENGLLASTDDQWIASFEMLIDSAELRRRLGSQGRLTVESRYSMRHCAELFAGVVRETVGSRAAITDQPSTEASSG